MTSRKKLRARYYALDHSQRREFIVKLMAVVQRKRRERIARIRMRRGR